MSGLHVVPQDGDRVRCTFGENTVVGTLRRVFDDGSKAVQIDGTPPGLSSFITADWFVERLPEAGAS